MSLSQLEEQFALQISAYELPEPVRQYRLPELPERKWLFDFAFVPERLLVEINGATWVSNSGHTSGKGIERDTEKLCTAVTFGYRVLMVTGMQVKDGRAIAWVHSILKETHGRE